METMNLIFYFPPRWMPEEAALAFEVSADGEHILCLLPGEELMRRYGAASATDEAEAMKAFTTYRDEIEQSVRSHLERHGLPPAGPQGRVLRMSSFWPAEVGAAG